MEYQRQFDGIQADFARRAAELLWQYEAMTSRVGADDDEPRYEGTLTICVLQALLTQCTELLSSLESEDITREYFNHDVGHEAHPWGLRQDFVTANSLPGSLTLKSLLTHLRNAVSHPSFVGPKSVFVPTGFTTTGAPGTPIDTYRFTDSPWVKNGNRHFKQPLPGKREKDVLGLSKQFDREWGVQDYLSVVSMPDGRFDLAHHGEIYWPVFQIDLPLFELRKLTRELANYLAHKTLSDWDGRTIQRFVPPLAA
jgi:hypothetical protein